MTTKNNDTVKSKNDIQLPDPLTLPCGAVIKNRLGKSALTEGLATCEGVPTPALERLYGLWSDGGAGLLISGNIQVDRDHLERPGNVILHGGIADTNRMKDLRSWAKAGTRQGNHFWVQLSHGGRQVRKEINPSPKAPSAVKLGVPGGQFGTPVPLTIDEIHKLVDSFVKAAKTCQQAGFTGVQFHSAHGYLLSSFLNPLANQRTDEYGGSLENRARMLLDVVRKTREQLGPNFPIAVKLNSADFQRGGFQFEDSLQVVQWLQAASIDLIEISGGNYEQGAMMNLVGLEDKYEQHVNVAPSTKAREAYFLDFAKAMQEVVQVPLMVTGGFRSREAMNYALESGGADIIGLGRPLCVLTDACNLLLENKTNELPRYENALPLLPPWLGFLKRFQMMKVVDSFASTFWFFEQLISLGETGRTKADLGVFQALLSVETRHRRILAEREAQRKAGTTNREGGLLTARNVVVVGMLAIGVGYYLKSPIRK